GEPTLEARAEMSLFKLCLARRRKAEGQSRRRKSGAQLFQGNVNRFRKVSTEPGKQMSTFSGKASVLFVSFVSRFI
ncbi:MAG: hypothetical protein IK000_03510, partial [Bacteroidaceae bacterium]|nr:hypothetical protein [Bacteroidaceae bacterium]